MSGIYAAFFLFGYDAQDPGMEDALQLATRAEAERMGYHPTDEPGDVLWAHNVITLEWLARVSVPIQEEEAAST